MAGFQVTLHGRILVTPEATGAINELKKELKKVWEESTRASRRSDFCPKDTVSGSPKYPQQARSYRQRHDAFASYVSAATVISGARLSLR
jgi:hypothetical protein